MARQRGRTKHIALLVLGAVALFGVLAVVDVGSIHPALDTVVGGLWTALFWALVFVAIGLLVWQIFPTPSQ